MRNDKKGFTLIELMFVMVLLAIMVIIAYPYVLNSYKKAQKDTFLTEAKSVYRRSKEKYSTDAYNGNKSYKTITDSDASSLNLSNSEIKYCVHLTDKGNVIDIRVTNGKYYVEGLEDFLSTGTLETVKYGDFSKFSCDYVLDEADIQVEPTLKEIRADEGYMTAIKWIGIAFIVTVIAGLITSNKNRRYAK